MELKINIEKKHFWILAVMISLLAIAFIVYAANPGDNSASAFGHTGAELASWKACSCVYNGPYNWRDTMIVPYTWTGHDCGDWCFAKIGATSSDLYEINPTEMHSIGYNGGDAGSGWSWTYG